MFKVNFRTQIASYMSGQAKPGGPGGGIFLCSKKGNSFKAETIKRLSPRPRYYCFSYSRASKTQKLFFSANHGGRQ